MRAATPMLLVSAAAAFVTPAGGRTAATKPLTDYVFKHRRLALLAPAATALILTSATIAQAARKPTSRERGAIEQAIFDDYLHSHRSVAHAVIRTIRISTRTARRPRRNVNGYYGAFARVDLFDSTASGPGAAILAYRVGPIPGWRVLDLGSIAVGCRLPASIFRGQKAAVLGDLKFPCP